MGKVASGTFPPEVHTGKLTEEKVVMIRDSWVRYLERKFPGKGIAALVSYSFKVVEGEGSSAKVVDEVLVTFKSHDYSVSNDVWVHSHLSSYLCMCS